MKFNVVKRIISASTAALCLMASVPAVPLTASAKQENIIRYEGYDYEYWSDDSDVLEFEIDKKGGFDASWHTYGNCFFGKGLIDQTPASNNYKIDYDVSINFGAIQNASAFGAKTYLCAYGFLKNPTAEFFFIDYDSDPSQYENSESFTPLGSFENDGKTYDLYCNKATKYGIDGSYSYDRYISIRRGGVMKDRYANGLIWGETTEYDNYKGEIDVGAHFEALEKSGIRIGDLARLSFNVESYKCNGVVKLNSCELTEQPEDNTAIRTSGTFERKGGTYFYSSTCRPSKIYMNVYKENNEPEFDFTWPDGSNSITKEIVSGPVKIGANDVILIKEDYSFKLHGDEDPDNRFSGILEMDLNDDQKIYLVDTGINVTKESIAKMYSENSIDAESVDLPNGTNIIDLTETIYAADKRQVCVYPFTYTVKNDDKEEKHTDYWIKNFQNDTYSYNQFTREYSESTVLPDTTYRSYNIHKASEIFSALEECGLSVDTLNSASFVFSSEKLGGKLTVDDLSMDITHFPDGPYHYRTSFYGEGDFALKSNENGVFSFEWYNQKTSGCTAEAGRLFDGDGLALTNVKSIVADYSVTVDSVEIFGTKNDPTAVYLHGRLPFNDSATDEFFIDIAYLGNRDEKKRSSHLSAPNPYVEDNERTYDIYRTYKYDFPVAEYEMRADDDAPVYYQYWSMEQEPPVNGEDPAQFSGTVDITKHIEKYIATEDSNKNNILKALTICADASHSTGYVNIDRFNITVTYNDGTVEKYTPCGTTKNKSGEITGDLNGDSIINSLDVALCRREILNAESSTSVNKRADMDGDGKVQLNDLVLLTSFVLGG